MFTQLFLTHHTHIVRTLYRILGDLQESEDLAQEVFVILHRSWETLVPEKIKAWLTQVAIHTAFNHLRSRKRLAHRHQKAAEIQAVASAHPSQKNEAALMIRTILHHRLTENQATLLLLYAEGLRYDEIAEVMSISRTSVSQLLLRAKRAFSEAYHEDKEL